jgi:hypothetical protein
MPTPEERLATIAERVSPCPAPDVSQGRDQCAHGTWPCEQTEVAWLARGTDYETEIAKVRQQWQNAAATEDAYWEMKAEEEAAAAAGLGPDWWRLELEADQETEAAQ